MSSPHRSQSAGTRWDPEQYRKFGDQRLRPALELLDRARVESPRVIVDLGCGSGEVTRLIAERFPDAAVTGIDNSPEMLARAAENPGQVEWIEADIGTWVPITAPDLIYANASLQWLPGHRQLFPRLAGFLKPGGCLAVQMPLSFDAPSHRLMRESLAHGGPDAVPLGSAELRQSMERNWVEEPQAYFDILSSCMRHLDIWETTYLQLLQGPDPVLEWVKGTGLRPILNSLDHTQREIFLAEYSRRLREAYPMRDDGCTLFPFRRLFLVAGF